jgi:drug/metabolite transporter (DMT)-like permease
VTNTGVERMKAGRNPFFLRLAALFVSVVLSTSASLFAKYALVSFSPFALAALRVWIASLVMLPLATLVVPKGLSWRRFIKALPMSLCYAVNTALFLLGIDHTTAIAAQLLYMLVPVIVLISSRFLFSEQLTPAKLFGTTLGIAGAVVVLIGSLEGSLGDSLGTPLGNGVMLVSVLLWSAFTLLARRQSQSQHPIELSCYAQITSSLVIPLFLVPDIALHHPLWGTSVTWLALISVLALALLISVCRDILFQWGLQGTSAFTTSVMGFFAPFLTVAYAIPLLGERLSLNLLISGALIIVGIFFAVIMPARQQRGKQPAPEPALVGAAENEEASR